MTKEKFSFRHIYSPKNLVCSGLPVVVESTLNMPLVTALNMLITKGHVTYSMKELFRGWTVTTIPYIPVNFIMFSMKNLLCSYFPYTVRNADGHITHIKMKEAFIVGGLSGIATGISCTPIERIQVYQNARTLGLTPAIKEVVHKQGVVKGLFNGVQGSIYRDVPFTIGLFSVSDYMDNFMNKKFSRFVDRFPRFGSISVTMASRLLSGSTIGLITVPFNNIRIYQQGVDATQNLNFWQAAKIVREKNHLMTGWEFRVGRIAMTVVYLRAAESAFRWIFNNYIEKKN